MTDVPRTDFVLESWLKETDPTTPDASSSIARVMDRVPGTRQRGRWWPLPSPQPPAQVPRSNGQKPARGFAMFSALKFVVAGVIVALFGGYLLAGTVSSPPEGDVVPAAATASAVPQAATEATDALVDAELLPGVTLASREVEPGIWEVDGGYELMPTIRAAQHGGDQLVAGRDGSLHLATKAGLTRLGDAKPLRWKRGWTPSLAARLEGIEVAPDGTVWLARSKGVLSHDGDAWTVWMEVAKDDRSQLYISDLEVGDDGTVLVTRTDVDADTVEVLRFDDDAWMSLGTFPARYMETAWDDGHEYERSILDTFGQQITLVIHDPLRVHRHDGTGWAEIAPPSLEPLGWVSNIHSADAGADGTLWLGTLSPGGWALAGVAYHDGDGWVHNRQAEDPHLDDQEWWWGVRAVTPDGSAWTGGRPSMGCDGVQRYEALDLTHHLMSGLCPHSITAAADGSVWVFAGPDAMPGHPDNHRYNKFTRLYVITPEALTARS